MSTKACIFIDGENLRHAIIDLFPNEFHKTDYLPKEAGWSSWFDNIVALLPGTYERLRSYWYVAGELDCFPHFFPRDKNELKQFLSTDKEIGRILSQLHGEELQKQMAETVSGLETRKQEMKSRFHGWQVFHNGISTQQDSIEFRASGYLRYDAFTHTIKAEKAVDINLAVDLVMLRDTYDIAVILSGDGDYIPAVQAVKDSGKKVVNISFLTRGGKRLPGGAARLNRSCDCSIDIKCEDLAPFLKLKLADRNMLI